MDNKEVIKSKPDLGPIVICLLPLALFLSFAVILIKSALSYDSLSYLGLIAGCFFGLVSILLINYVLKFDILILEEDKLRTKSLLGYPKKVIYLQEITSYIAIDKEDKYFKWQELTIYSNKTEYCISSMLYPKHYATIKEILIKQKVRDQKTEVKYLHGRLKYVEFFCLFFMFTMTLLCMYWSWRSYKDSTTKLSDKELTTISSTLLNKAEIKKHGRSSSTIEIELKEYPDFLFEIVGSTFSAMAVYDYASTVKTGDTLFLKILTEDYQNIITKEKLTDIEDKKNSPRYISVYGLTDQNYIYLSLDEYNKEHRTDLIISIWMGAIVGICLLGLDIYLLINRKKIFVRNVLLKRNSSA
ncbi:hypothetical protein QNI16_25365 [Cytophagaceae bacterium YF14B1]|uniref:Uncharacterized protein n=1 Tax=Xanthocytophaga flava TaxID=3048013 RepID=A0AAE3QR39_9BACT|nr:hypothetical protein [Xanthocytophaga flavus]MDJ1483855.1 hypothetical protein [Xanthocytophaga flavus]